MQIFQKYDFVYYLYFFQYNIYIEIGKVLNDIVNVSSTNFQVNIMQNERQRVRKSKKYMYKMEN